MIVILIEKIVSLFFVMLLGVLLVRSHILKADDSRTLSTLCIYLIMPCVILEAFQVDYYADTFGKCKNNEGAVSQRRH